MTEEKTERNTSRPRLLDRPAVVMVGGLSVALLSSATALIAVAGMSMSLSEKEALASEPDEQRAPGRDEDGIPRVLADLGVDEERVRKRFSTEAGLTGWVLKPEQGEKEPGLVYTTRDGKHALTGAMIGPDQEVLSRDHLAQHTDLSGDKAESGACGGSGNGGKPGAGDDSTASDSDNATPDSAEALEALAQAKALTQGEGEAEAYVIMDPHCPYSHRFYETAQKLTRNVTFHWVPVGYLGQQSMTDAAAILAADDPLAAFEAAMSGETVDAEGSDAERERIQEHNELASAAGLDGTPGMVLVDADGEVRAVRQGALPAQALREALGL